MLRAGVCKAWCIFKCAFYVASTCTTTSNFHYHNGVVLSQLHKLGRYVVLEVVKDKFRMINHTFYKLVNSCSKEAKIYRWLMSFLHFTLPATSVSCNLLVSFSLQRSTQYPVVFDQLWRLQVACSLHFFPTSFSFHACLHSPVWISSTVLPCWNIFL